MTQNFQDLEKYFLPFVEKPSRYLGGEVGLARLPEFPSLRVSLAFPDLYELGMSYLGLRILLHLANGIPGVACERIFMPWFDAARRLQTLNLPLFTLETRTPLKDLDLIGINLQYELHATNILGLLELGGIPRLATNRNETDPIIIGGGPLAFHPEPLAPFFDAIAVGDGEELFPEVLNVLKAEKAKGSSRSQKLRALGDLAGIYLPTYYEPQYSKSGDYQGLMRLDDTLPLRILSRVTAELKPEYYPTQPIVPILEATHNRLILEIARGCSRGCRFCAAGMNHRPVRERPIDDLIKEADSGLATTGYNEISLLSLSTADYSCLEQLLFALDPVLTNHHASLSFPSLRPDLFTPQMADRAAAGSRTGLTFAPEAASSHLRGVINKDTSDEALLNSARLAFERGWKSLKLYFMIGLPTESDDDIWAMVDLICELENVSRVQRGAQIKIAISPFSPKPHTPFEREGQLSVPELRRRFGLLRRGLQRCRNVKLEMRAPEITRIETALARSDRRGAEAILKSHRAGGLFDAWSDGFSAERWENSFAQSGLDLDQLTGAIQADRPLPWEHISSGVDSGFLLMERQTASRAELTTDCRTAGCQFCGLQTRSDVPCPEVVSPATHKMPIILRNLPPTEPPHRYRLRYQRTPASRFNAHLNTVGAFERALRRLGIPLEFTQGFKPHLRLIASPPLALGMTTQAEYLDFGLLNTWSNQFLDKLQEGLPAGYIVQAVQEIPPGQPSIGALNVLQYSVRFKQTITGIDLNEAMTSLLLADALPVQRITPKTACVFDARPSLWRLAYVEGTMLLGLISHGGPLPRVEEILKLLFTSADTPPDLSPAGIMAEWEIERLGMWWKIEGIHYAPDQAITRTIVINNQPT